jgi:hypothetical protein
VTITVALAHFSIKDIKTCYGFENLKFSYTSVIISDLTKHLCVLVSCIWMTNGMILIDIPQGCECTEKHLWLVIMLLCMTYGAFS